MSVSHQSAPGRAGWLQACEAPVLRLRAAAWKQLAAPAGVAAGGGGSMGPPGGKGLGEGLFVQAGGGGVPRAAKNLQGIGGWRAHTGAGGRQGAGKGLITHARRTHGVQRTGTHGHLVSTLALHLLRVCVRFERSFVVHVSVAVCTGRG